MDQEDEIQANILIVDDILENLNVLSSMLKKEGFKVRPAPSGRLALKAAKTEPPDLIILDIQMPEMDGYEVCRRLKNDDELKNIPVIFLSALSDAAEKVKAFEVGGLDFISKPFHFEEVNARVETHLKLRRLQMELEDLVQEKIIEISKSQMSTIFALAKLAESRDDVTGRHIERVREYSNIIAKALRGNPRFGKTISKHFINNFYHATPLHDIGKVGIEDKILLKPGKLTENEFVIMKTHTTIGAQTLEFVRERYPNNEFINLGIEIARSHHEKWDGSGYPDYLMKEDIPVSARIMAIADVYDALRSSRPYKNPFTHEKSKRIILSLEGKQFDPDIVKAFIENDYKFERLHYSFITK